VIGTPTEPISVNGLLLDVAAMSEQGPRSENQDAYSLETLPTMGIVAVADGMGGERSGRVAADTALRAVLDAGPLRSLDDARRAVRQADATVARLAQQNPDAHGGMGCALGFISLSRRAGDGDGWIAAHVGDVRILSLAPDGTIRLETRDHTPAFAKWEAGEISLDEIPDTAGANRLQRAVGRGGEADVVWLPARPGWSWLLVSDGIYKAVRLDELARLMEAPSSAAAVDAIRRKVQERGPDDNFTAVMVRALGDHRTGISPEPHADTIEQPLPVTAPVTRRAGPSATAVLALLFSLIALAAAGYSYWTQREASKSAVRPAAVDSLGIRLDTLAAQVQRLEQPFGPSTSTAPDSGAAATRSAIPR
jgi:serine/threonine protein phosphatase PrpC